MNVKPEYMSFGELFKNSNIFIRLHIKGIIHGKMNRLNNFVMIYKMHW